MPKTYHCSKCKAVIDDYVAPSSGLQKHSAVSESKCGGHIVEKTVSVPVLTREGKALPARTVAVTISTTESTSQTYAKGYRWLGDKWSSEIVVSTGSVAKAAKGKTKITVAPKAHAEQQVYVLVQAAEKKTSNWVGFTQNAPPCVAQCLVYFVNESRSRTGGFIFNITADHADYCKDYTILNEGVKPEAPFKIYVWSGKWGFEAPKDAPTVDLP